VGGKGGKGVVRGGFAGSGGSGGGRKTGGGGGGGREADERGVGAGGEETHVRGDEGDVLDGSRPPAEAAMCIGRVV
jgi:hypothetical protein